MPSAIAAAEMKRLQQAWIDSDPTHNRDNRMFVIRFDNPGARVEWPEYFGYAEKWAQYHLGDIDLPADGNGGDGNGGDPAAEISETPTALLERHRNEIASELGVIPEAIEISVNLFFADKTGKLRSAFVR